MAEDVAGAAAPVEPLAAVELPAAASPARSPRPDMDDSGNYMPHPHCLGARLEASTSRRGCDSSVTAAELVNGAAQSDANAAGESWVVGAFRELKQTISTSSPVRLMASHSTESSRKRRLSQSSSMSNLELMPGAAGLQAITAAQAITGLGAAFCGQVDLSRKCKEVEHIDHFWSYSRHAFKFSNVSTMLLHYKGVPSSLAGWLAAVLTANLAPLLTTHDEKTCGLLTMLVGVICTASVFFLWPSRHRVFLDTACIPQSDDNAKRVGILSLPYFLKSSHLLMVIWDPTYFERIWCVFEFAVFLRLKLVEGIPRRLKVLTASYGGMTVCILIMSCSFKLLAFITGTDNGETRKVKSMEKIVETTIAEALLGGLVLLMISRILGTTVRAILAQGEQVENFHARSSKCFCCSVNHVLPETGQRIDCDRRLIESVITDWFGDLDNFDRFVRDEIKEHTHHRVYMPYCYCLFASQVQMWEDLGRCAWLIHAGQHNEAMHRALDRVCQELFLGPVLMACICKLFALVEKRAASRWRCTRAVLSMLLCMLLLFFVMMTSKLVVLAFGEESFFVYVLVFGVPVFALYWRHLV